MKCPYCKKPAIWTENKIIYGRNYGKSFMCYYCKPCDAYVGCHNNTRKPLGTMAKSELRELRKTAHAVFDPLWRNRQHKRRHQLYKEISRHFGKEIHIAESDEDMCKQIIEWALNKRNEIKYMEVGG